MKHILITAFAAVLLVGCGESPKEISIHDAAVAGDIEAVKQHLAAGADVNAKAGIGWTPLHHAARTGHKEIVELLIDKGADVNVKNEWGWTPLHHAASKEIAELLIANGADMNAMNDEGETPLDWASTGYENEPPEDKIARKETTILLRKHGGKTGEELKAEGK